jgi:hypothetical protein
VRGAFHELARKVREIAAPRARDQLERQVLDHWETWNSGYDSEWHSEELSEHNDRLRQLHDMEDRCIDLETEQSQAVTDLLDQVNTMTEDLRVSRNFVTFRPRKTHVIIEFKLPPEHGEEMKPQLEAVGMRSLAYDSQFGFFRASIDPTAIDKQREVVRELTKKAWEGYGRRSLFGSTGGLTNLLGGLRHRSPSAPVWRVGGVALSRCGVGAKLSATVGDSLAGWRSRSGTPGSGLTGAISFYRVGETRRAHPGLMPHRGLSSSRCWVTSSTFFRENASGKYSPLAHSGSRSA